MSSTFILKFRLCLEPIKPFSTLKTSLCKSHPSARSLSTRGPGHPDRKTKVGQGGVRDGNPRKRVDELWQDLKGTRSTRSSPTQRPSVPKSVFAAGTAKRTTEMLKRMSGAGYEDEEPKSRLRKVKMQPPDRPLSVSEWKQLKESAENPEQFYLQMMTAIVISNAELDIAKSLLTCVATETGSLSYEILLQYLVRCVKGNHDSEVFDIYDIMRASFPSLESGASSLFIKSFSRTERWREALDILHRLNKFLRPSIRNYGQIISAAVLHGDNTTAWAVYDELMENEVEPPEETLVDMFKGARGKIEEGEGAMSEAQHHERLLGILLHMRNNQIYPRSDLANAIKTWFESRTGQKWKGTWTSPNSKGMCKCCGSKLETIELTDEEYQQLKNRVMIDVIQGKDEFHKTTPEELQRFKMFVEKMPAFDVVIDGLNVANSCRDRTKQSASLLAVVLELKRQGRNILVLGRKHMLQSSRSWQKLHMNQIQERAHCFFTENISKDDPFLLYATLNSGNHCQFVSRDLMRDHKACLSDDTIKRLFFKWQRGHQLVVQGHLELGRRVQFQSISTYDTIIQTAKDSWHLPYDDTEDRTSCEVPQRWLCLTNNA